jgi:protein O-mannosyl-transferase
MRERWDRWHVSEVTLALLALVASGVGVVNRFAYDDVYVIERNPLVHSLHAWWRGFAMSYWPKDAGGDGYRPLTILAFRLEWAIGHGTPVVFHVASILLYALAAVLVFWIARKVLPLPAAWLAAALFAVHPVHVEAVANVVGQSELIVACAFLAAVIMYLHDRERGELRPRTAVLVALLFAVACFAKEHAVVLPAILVAAELTVIVDAAPARERIMRLRPFYLGLLAIAIAFVGVRSAVLADHSFGGFAPFIPFSSLHISPRDRMLTAVGVVPEWTRLLYWPARLSSDYGPPDIDIAQGLSMTQVPGFLLLVAIIALGVVLRRRQPAISFGIWFTAITLLPSSNFILPAGIVLAERTLFLPSVGAMIIGGALCFMAIHAVDARVADGGLRRSMRFAPLGLVLLLGAGHSAARTTVWRDNDVLLRRAVIDSPRSYHAHYMLGAWELDHKRLRLGEAEFKRALSLFPYDPAMTFNLAEQYSRLGICHAAIPLYQWSRGLEPRLPVTIRFAECLLNEGDYPAARVAALEAIRAGGNLPVLRHMIFAADSAKAANAQFSQEVQPAVLGRHGKAPDPLQKAALVTSPDRRN